MRSDLDPTNELGTADPKIIGEIIKKRLTDFLCSGDVIIMIRSYAVERRINNLEEQPIELSPLFSILTYFNCVTPKGVSRF
jgi:hypothetical protein